ncbi:EamA family transporter [Streptomyces sp. SID7803]|nr:EamA family transporter [Streptomyces sp. SID7803]
MGAIAAVALAAASYAIGFAYIWGATSSVPVSPTISLSAAQLVVATALTAVTVPFGGLKPVDISAKTLVVVVVLGVVATAATFHLTYRNIAAEGGATNTATLGYLLPVVSVALGVVVLGEDFNVRLGVGMVVVLVGVAVTRSRRGERPVAVEEPQPTTRG